MNRFESGAGLCEISGNPKLDRFDLGLLNVFIPSIDDNGVAFLDSKDRPKLEVLDFDCVKVFIPNIEDNGVDLLLSMPRPNFDEKNHEGFVICFMLKVCL